MNKLVAISRTMENLEEQKLIEEIKSLKSDRNANFLKGIALLIGAIVLFIAIQRPESILNRKLSQETISRERAKLIFELTQQNKNPEEVIFGLSIIENAYPEENSEWIDNIKSLYNTKFQSELNEIKINQLDSIYQERLYQSRIELQDLLDKKEKYQLALFAEMDGTGGTGKVGVGPMYRQISMLIDENDKRIEILRNRIDELESEIEINLKTATNKGYK